MTLSDALLVADGYGGDAAQALAALAAEVRRLHWLVMPAARNILILGLTLA